MEKQDLLLRFKKFAKDVIKLVEGLPPGKSSYIMGNQLIRSGTSVYMNYRAAKRGRSTAEFIAKMGIVEEEADESLAWIELLIETGVISEEKGTPLKNEANQIVAIVVASIKTAKKKK